MSDSSLKSSISEAVKDAMRAKDKPRLAALRLVSAEIKRVEVDERIDPDDARVTEILDKMVKQRRESIRQFEAGGRAELAAREQQEIDIIQEFLPAALDAAELDAIIQSALAESGAASMQDMGKVMALVKPQVLGRADMAAVSQKVRAALG